MKQAFLVAAITTVYFSTRIILEHYASMSYFEAVELAAAVTIANLYCYAITKTRGRK